MEDLKKVLELFMSKKDLKALELLYKITNDELIKILINWYKEFEEIENEEETNEYFMYDDLIQYVFKKYKLEKM